MKVIGEAGHRKYICEVSHVELEKFLNLYYRDGLKTLQPGDTINLGRGYDFHRDIKDGFKQTQDFIKGHQKTVNAIMNGLTINMDESITDNKLEE